MGVTQFACEGELTEATDHLQYYLNLVVQKRLLIVDESDSRQRNNAITIKARWNRSGGAANVVPRWSGSLTALGCPAALTGTKHKWDS